MNSALEAFVNNICPPTRITLYRDAVDTLEEYSIEEFEGDVLNDVFSLGVHGPVTTVDLFHQKVEAYHRQVLEAHSIKVSEEARLEELVVLSSSVLAMQSFIDHGLILQICETDLPALEKFAEVVFLVNGQSVDRTYPLLLDVDQNFLDRLEEIHTKREREAAQTELAAPELITNLRLVRRFINYEDAVGWKLIRRNVPIGANLAVYLNFAKKHTEHFEDELVAKELFIFLYMAKDTYKNPLLGFRTASQHVFDDILRITKIDIRLAQLVSDFESYKKTHLNNTTASMMQ